MIYLASPYTAETKEQEEQNYQNVLRFVGRLMTGKVQYSDNRTVWSPIVHNHVLALLFDLPKDHLFWKERNHDFIRRCDELWIACIDGWEKSKGVLEEVAFARTCGIPVKYILEETL